jgi:hypothetical protein
MELLPPSKVTKFFSCNQMKPAFSNTAEGKVVRVKDLYNLTKTLQLKPLPNKRFGTNAGNEFQLACEARYVDCTGLDSQHEGWTETKELYLKDPTIPKDLAFDKGERARQSVHCGSGCCNLIKRGQFYTCMWSSDVCGLILGQAP